jgi:hypothetical protein
MQTAATEGGIIQVSAESKVTDIQTALRMATPGSTIRVFNGFYKGFAVTKPGVTIEAAQGQDNVVILADKGDSIVVDCPSTAQVILRGLKVAHTVSKAELDINKLINLFFKKKKAVKGEAVDYTSTVAHEYNRNISQACLLRVISGDVYVAQCYFSFKIMSKSLETITPAVVAEAETRVHLVGCEITGHRIYPTVGVLCQRGELVIEESKIFSNLGGAISAVVGELIR